jgi:hypothetical protein
MTWQKWGSKQALEKRKTSLSLMEVFNIALKCSLQILRRQTSRSHYGSKVPVVTVTVFKYRNKIGKIFVKAVPYYCL